MFFAAVTARYTLQLSAMNANVLLCGADKFLLHEKAAECQQLRRAYGRAVSLG
jgi:hypothetical protein